MPFNTQAALQAGYSQQEIDRYLAKKNAQNRTGISKFLFGESTGAPSMAFNAVANTLNIPSYAIGGMLDEYQKQGSGAFNPLKNPFGIKGAISGLKNKEAVMQELPETFGIDPNSPQGLALGFAGELLTPNIPVEKLANVFKGGKAVSRLNKPNIFETLTRKAGESIDEAGKSLSVRALRPSPSQIRELEDVSKIPFGDFIAKNNLYGSGKTAVGKADELIAPLQLEYNALVRNGQKVSPLDYVRALRAKAKQIRATDFSPEARSVADAIDARAKIFGQTAKNFGKTGIPIDILTNSKSSAFSKVPKNALADPTVVHAGEIAGKVGIDVLDQFAPGSKELGKQLQGLRTFRNIAKKQSGIGRGSQVFNTVKSNFAGLGAGGALGYAVGNPILGGAVGMTLGAASTNPRVLSAVSRAGTGLGSSLVNNAELIGKGAQSGFNAGRKTLTTAGRVYPTLQSSRNRLLTPSTVTSLPEMGLQNQGLLKEQNQSEQSTLLNNSPFGKRKRVLKGNFY